MANLLSELDAIDLSPCEHGADWGHEQESATAALNFLRTHRAEIAAAVRDSQRLDWLENECHQLTWSDEGERLAIRAEDGAEATGETWREAIDRIAAMSAREGQG